MKRAFIMLLLLQLCSPAFASWPQQLERALLRAGQSFPKDTEPQKSFPWKVKLNQIREQFRPIRSSFVSGPLPAVQDRSLSYNEEQAYMFRLLSLQQLVNQNPDLKGLHFFAPVPYDLAQLSADRMETLSFFLQDKPLGQPVSVELVRPFTLAVKLGKLSSALELWIDIPTKKIYLMSNNFCTTAAGKYGTHLL